MAIPEIELRAAALREAQSAMKAEHPDPFYRGAFIRHGDLGSLPVQARMAASSS